MAKQTATRPEMPLGAQQNPDDQIQALEVAAQDAERRAKEAEARAGRAEARAAKAEARLQAEDEARKAEAARARDAGGLSIAPLRDMAEELEILDAAGRVFCAVALENHSQAGRAAALARAETIVADHNKDGTLAAERRAVKAAQRQQQAELEAAQAVKVASDATAALSDIEAIVQRALGSRGAPKAATDGLAPADPKTRA